MVEPLVALSNYSYIIKMNEKANSLIAKVEVPYNSATLNAKGALETSTYVATLLLDKYSWVVNDSTSNVDQSEDNTRISKMTSLNGENMLAGIDR
jgi:hypothetical protein